jgi:hypothetical protein
MLETIMYVRCTHCGYDNSPEYRFCGMCGASLAHPPISTKAPVKPPLRDITPVPNSLDDARVVEKPEPPIETVNGPSFLGLGGDETKSEFHYLYEDEPPRSYAGLIAVVIILAAVAGAGVWQWRHHGFPFNRLTAGNAPAASASPSEVSPAQTQDQQTHVDKPMTGAGDVLPTQPEQGKQADTGKTNEFPAQGGQTAPGTPGNAPANGGTAQQEAASDDSTPTKAPEEPKAQQEAKATPPGVTPAAKRSAARPPAPKPVPKAAPAAPGVKTLPDADLELAGERYLYGTGVPQNCARAESSLRTAATHGNSKAETVLGTMYATGHCVGRDLPAAYRWFARALRQDPQNSRISADLQVLWRQMNAQERQLAMANGR